MAVAGEPHAFLKGTSQASSSSFLPSIFFFCCCCCCCYSLSLSVCVSFSLSIYFFSTHCSVSFCYGICLTRISIHCLIVLILYSQTLTSSPLWASCCAAGAGFFTSPMLHQLLRLLRLQLLILRRLILNNVCCQRILPPEKSLKA